MALAPQTLLREKYLIQGVLGQDGPFDTTYRAADTTANRTVVIREFCPSALLRRAENGTLVEVIPASEELFLFGKTQFLKEGAVVRRLDHPHVVKEVDAFEANGTAYRVSEYHEGAMLAAVLMNRNAPLNLTPAFRIMKALLSGLHAAHEAGIIHGGISPTTVYLDMRGHPMLFGFRTARMLLARKMGMLADEGDVFKAPEQHEIDGRQGPWTDVYASAATLVYLLTGKTIAGPTTKPPEDDDFFQKTDLALPFQNALSEALHVNPTRRPRTIAAFKERLVEAALAVEEAASTAEKEDAPAEVAAGEEISAASQEEPVSGETPRAKQGGEQDDERDVENLDGSEGRHMTGTEGEGPALDIDKEEPAQDESEGASSQDEPPTETHAPRRSFLVRKGFLACITGVVVIALLVWLGYLLSATVAFGIGGSGAPGFDTLKAQGDSLVEAGYYAPPTAFYERALVARPDDDHVSRRLSESEQRIQEEGDSLFAMYVEYGDVLMIRADSLLGVGLPGEALAHYNEANRTYLQALPYRPDDPDLVSRIERISTRIHDTGLADSP